MGYSDISIVGSDMASDECSFMIDAMVKSLAKTLKKDSNEFNTSGPVNVALVFKERLLPGKFYKSRSERLLKLAEMTHAALKIETLAASRAVWDDGDNKRTHLRAYRSLLRSMKRFINHAKSQ